jgi:hypothetical protein
VELRPAGQPAQPDRSPDARGGRGVGLATDGIGYWVVELCGRIIGVAGTRSLTLEGHGCWKLYCRFAALRAAGDLDPRRLVVVRTRPTNGAAARLAGALGMTRAPALDSHGFITFGSHGERPTL